MQRFQYARYHVTDPNDFFNANHQWQVSPDAVAQGTEPGADPDVHARPRRPGSETWSLTSSYVPNNKTNLAGFVTADSDPTTPDYGTITVEEPRSENVPGPAQAYSQLISDPQITRKTQSFRLGDATPQYGNVVSVPLAVRPDVRRTGVRDAAADLVVVVPHPALRDGVLRHEGRDRRHPRRRHHRHGRHHPTARHTATATATTTTVARTTGKGAMAKAHALLEKAQADFAAADQALAEGKGAEWVAPQPPGPRRGRQGPQPAEVVTPARFERPHRPPVECEASDAGWSSSVARWAHNPEVAGSNPAPATNVNPQVRGGFRRNPEAAADASLGGMSARCPQGPARARPLRACPRVV